MKTTVALFLLVSLAAPADTRRSYEDFHADPERGIVRLPRTEHSDGTVTMTYLNVNQIVRLTIKSDGKGPDARATLIIVTSEVEPIGVESEATTSKHLTYEIRFPSRQHAEDVIQKMFAKHKVQAGADQPVSKPAEKPPLNDQPSTPMSKESPR